MRRAEVPPSELADWLIGHGEHFISTAEAAQLLGVRPETVPASLERAREAGKLVSVTKGGWVPVPPEHRVAGAPPASHYIDQLMKHLSHQYYVGLLSAAAIHGSSHQSPMVFQVVISARLRDRRIGRSRIQFMQRAAAAERPKEQHNVPTGRIWVSTPEVTVFDLVESPQRGGGISNVATVIGDLLHDDRLASELLAQVASLYPSAVAQRVGYLVDLMAAETGIEFGTTELHERVEASRYRDLVPGDGSGENDERWHVVVNTDIEHDL